jgi:hypothetical protein
MAEHVSISELRSILGPSAESMADAEVEAMRAEYERMAEVLFDQMMEDGRDGLEEARWDTHFRLTGRAE